MLIVADTNVLLSGILWPGGLPGQLIALVARGNVSLAVSPRILEEIERVLDQPKLNRFVAGRGGEALVATIVENLWAEASHAEHVEPAKNWLPADPADNWIIQCALTAKAERIITGDKRLLELGTVDEVKIVTVRQVLADLGFANP